MAALDRTPPRADPVAVRVAARDHPGSGDPSATGASTTAPPRFALALVLAVSLAACNPSPEPTAAPTVQVGRSANGLAYDLRGSGPAIVLITGSNLDRRMWQAEVGWLGQRFRVLEYDLRAHGASDSADRPFCHDSDLLALLDDTGIAHATLLGLSAGTTVAIDVALRAPDRVDRLVLVAPAIGGWVPTEPPPFFGALVEALRASDYPRAAEVLLASPVFDVPPEARALVRAMVTENDRLWSIPRELVQPPARPAIEQLQTLSVPMLVLVGERDLAAMHAQGELLAARVDGARLVTVPGGGHLLNLTSPTAFRALVSAFLEDTAGGVGEQR